MIDRKVASDPNLGAAVRASVSKEAIAAFCRRHHIRKLSLFGSVLRDDFRPDSDIDVLVEFEPGHAVGWGIIEIEEELSRLFGGGHKVDLVREKYLNPRLRDRILASAEVQYVEG
jgi:predicted nucleotidyltransferase